MRLEGCKILANCQNVENAEDASNYERQPREAGPPVLMAMLFAAIACSLGPFAYADNAACWGYGRDDTGRPDISCTALTERLLLSLRGASRADVVRAMNAPGRIIENEGLHFVSNYDRGLRGLGGDVSFSFNNGFLSVISAQVDGPPGAPSSVEFIWNAKLSGCSDFPGSKSPCNRPR